MRRILWQKHGPSGARSPSISWSRTSRSVRGAQAGPGCTPPPSSMGIFALDAIAISRADRPSRSPDGLPERGAVLNQRGASRVFVTVPEASPRGGWQGRSSRPRPGRGLFVHHGPLPNATTQGCREAPLRAAAVSRPPNHPSRPSQTAVNNCDRVRPAPTSPDDGPRPAALSRNRFSLPASLYRKVADRVGSLRGVTHRVGMSAAIDGVDFGTPRGGVRSLSADLRSTRFESSCPGDSPASRGHLAGLNNSTSPSLSHPMSRCRQQPMAIAHASCAARGRPQAPRRSMGEMEPQNG
jgi:hypothetical protein